MKERQFTSMAQKRRFEAHQREMERIRNEKEKNLESETASGDDAGSTNQTEPDTPTTKS